MTVPAEDSVGSAGGSRTMVAARNVAVRGAAEIVGKVATLVLMVAVARSLGEEGFGVFSFALAVALLLATVPAGGLTTVLVQRAAADLALLPRLLTQCLTLMTAIALPVFVVVGGAVALSRPGREGGVAVGVLLVAILIELWCEALRAGAQALQRQGGVSLALVAQRVLTTVFAVLLLAGGGGVVAVTLAYLAGNVVGFVGMVVVARRLGLRLERPRSGRAGLWELSGASFVIGVDSIVSMALFRLDAVLLGLFAGDRAVGHYSAAYRFLETVLFLTWVVNAAVFPALSSDPETWRVRRGIGAGLAAIGAVYVPFAVLLLVRPADLLALLYTAEFVTEGTLVLRLLALAPLAFALGYLCSYGLLAREERRKVLLASCVAAAANLLANLLVIPHYEARGAAAVTTASYALEVVVLARWLRRDIGLGSEELLRPLLVPALASLPFAAVLLTPLPVLAAMALGGAVYAAVWVLLAIRLAPEPIAVLRRLVRRS